MDSFKISEVTPDQSKLGRALAKILHVHGHGKKKKKKLHEEVRKGELSFPFEDEDEEQRERLAREAFFAGIFSSLSAIKAAYAQMQMAQCPYDPEEIQSADEVIVSELKNLSEMKHSFLKQQLPEAATGLAYEIQELKSVILTYELTRKRLDSQLKLKDSELTSLREKLAEIVDKNRLLEKGICDLGVQTNITLSNLMLSHFIMYHHRAVKSIQGFVKLLISGMESAGWDIDAAVDAIEPGVSFFKPSHKCYAFESFVCREMFDGFNYPNFFSHDQEDRKSLPFDGFLELNSMKSLDYLSWKGKSQFSIFCKKKYLRVVHPKMESSLFGNLEQWHLGNSGGFPETPFFSEFCEMAKNMWVLHCLAFSFHPQASIFQISKGSRFSEVWMEGLNDEAFSSHTDPLVAFTVVPGFRICRTVLPCQVYLEK